MLRAFLAVTLLFLTTLNCQLLKKDKNNIEGAGSEDIVSKDIDSDSQGSDSGSIEGLKTVYFDYDKSSLSAEAREILIGNVNWMKSHSEVKNLELEGHCDSLGSEAYNVGLGLRRASAVKNFLVEQGLAESRLSVISYGEERPLSQTESAKNRRVNFVPQY